MTARLSGIAFLLLVACRGSSPKQPGKVVTSDTQIAILDPISFTSETELAPGSYKTLDAIASTFVGNPA
jgi:outer membrane biogenesis lipoprotein LolB